jgi:hypothetical protein
MMLLQLQCITLTNWEKKKKKVVLSITHKILEKLMFHTLYILQFIELISYD